MGKNPANPMQKVGIYFYSNLSIRKLPNNWSSGFEGMAPLPNQYLILS